MTCTLSFSVEVLRLPGDHPPDLAVIADALLLMHTPGDLDVALRLAHDVNIPQLAKRVRHQARRFVVDDLRSKLKDLESSMDEDS